MSSGRHNSICIFDIIFIIFITTLPFLHFLPNIAAGIKILENAMKWKQLMATASGGAATAEATGVADKQRDGDPDAGPGGVKRKIDDA